MKIKIGEQEHDIETKKVTLIVPDASVTQKIEYPDHIVQIDFHRSLREADNQKTLSDFHERTIEYFRVVFPKVTDEELSAFQYGGTGYRHVLGRINLSLRCQDAGREFVWQYPEAGLHPSSQVLLADLLILLIRRALRINNPSEFIAEELKPLSDKLDFPNQPGA